MKKRSQKTQIMYILIKWAASKDCKDTEHVCIMFEQPKTPPVHPEFLFFPSLSLQVQPPLSGLSLYFIPTFYPASPICVYFCVYKIYNLTFLRFVMNVSPICKLEILSLDLYSAEHL